MRLLNIRKYEVAAHTKSETSFKQYKNKLKNWKTYKTY